MFLSKSLMENIEVEFIEILFSIFIDVENQKR